MKILAVETSAVAASCCVTEDGRVLGRMAVDAGLTHSRTLLPMVEQLLTDASLTVADMDVLAVSAGPGSFTGVRIGVAAIKGLALPADKPCVGVSTLAAMARLWEGIPMTATLCATMDARCGQVYAALFSLTEGEISRLTADEALSIETLRARLEALPHPVVLLGDGAALCEQALADLPGVAAAPVTWRMQDAVGVAAEAAVAVQEGKTVSARELMPTYLRVPQAERERLARLAASDS